jgi:hypothetical protein
VGTLGQFFKRIFAPTEKVGDYGIFHAYAPVAPGSVGTFAVRRREFTPTSKFAPTRVLKNCPLTPAGSCQIGVKKSNFHFAILQLVIPQWNGASAIKIRHLP